MIPSFGIPAQKGIDVPTKSEKSKSLRSPQFWFGVLIGTGVALAVKTLTSSDEGRALSEKLHLALEPRNERFQPTRPEKNKFLKTLPTIPRRKYNRRKRYFKQEGKKLNT
jgi:hypothetical protein